MEIQRLKDYHIVILHRLHDIGANDSWAPMLVNENYTMVNYIERGTTLLFSTFTKNQ